MKILQPNLTRWKVRFPTSCISHTNPKALCIQQYSDLNFPNTSTYSFIYLFFYFDDNGISTHALFLTSSPRVHAVFVNFVIRSHWYAMAYSSEKRNGYQIDHTFATYSYWLHDYVKNRLNASVLICLCKISGYTNSI